MPPLLSQLALLLSHLLLTAALGWYLILNLQWYSYKIERVLFKHHRRDWHFLYFALPFLLYYFSLGSPLYWLYFYLFYLPLLVFWHRKQDKKLVLTGRVKRFFALLVGVALLQDLLCLSAFNCAHLGVILPLLTGFVGSLAVEKYLFSLYYRQAKRRLATLPNLTIVAVTASYGKTSIKNFLAHLCEENFRIYKTPRSVNTLAGLVRDVNEELPEGTTLYIAEAGARERGDIKEIVDFLAPSHLIIGAIGKQHIDYFKTLEAVRATKKELLLSPGRHWAVADLSAGETDALPFGPEAPYGVEEIDASLTGTTFTLRTPDGALRLSTSVLGAFNAQNIGLAATAALALGVPASIVAARTATLTQVDHRLQRIDAGGKIILDDSFNGNLEGMSEGINLCRLHPGRRVIITPGLVESTPEANRELARRIDEVFDLVIITGALNAALLDEAITRPRKIILTDKRMMTDLLARETRAGDLIYFANDAPTFI